MFDVYLNIKQDRLLVIARGQPIPIIDNAGRWRKKRGTVTISAEIRSAVQKDGFYCRRLRDRNLSPGNNTISPVAARQLYQKYRELI
jgi:hypothetical protein